MTPASATRLLLAFFLKALTCLRIMKTYLNEACLLISTYLPLRQSLRTNGERIGEVEHLRVEFGSGWSLISQEHI